MALANARRHARALFGVELEDLVDERLPDLQVYEVAATPFVDAVTPAAIARLGLPPDYPNVPHAPCRAVAAAAYGAHERGVAALSAAFPDGEELAIFDREVASLVRPVRRDPFASWQGA